MFELKLLKLGVCLDSARRQIMFHVKWVTDRWQISCSHWCIKNADIRLLYNSIQAQINLLNWFLCVTSMCKISFAYICIYIFKLWNYLTDNECLLNRSIYLNCVYKCRFAHPYVSEVMKEHWILVVHFCAIFFMFSEQEKKTYQHEYQRKFMIIDPLWIST